MAVNAALRDYLKTRRSVGIGFLRDPGPNPEELHQRGLEGRKKTTHSFSRGLRAKASKPHPDDSSPITWFESPSKKPASPAASSDTQSMIA